MGSEEKKNEQEKSGGFNWETILSHIVATVAQKGLESLFELVVAKLKETKVLDKLEQFSALLEDEELRRDPEFLTRLMETALEYAREKAAQVVRVAGLGKEEEPEGQVKAEKKESAKASNKVPKKPARKAAKKAAKKTAKKAAKKTAKKAAKKTAKKAAKKTVKRAAKKTVKRAKK